MKKGCFNMNKIDTMICVIICCLLFGNIPYSSNNSIELSDNSRQNSSADWDLPFNGSFDIEILNLNLTDSGDWYELPFSTPPNASISFQIQFNATGLDMEQSFRLVLQLWSTHQNYSLIKHNDFQSNLFNTSTSEGNNDTHSSIHEIQMIDYIDQDQIMSRMHGCYWVEYSVTDNADNPNSLPSGTSDRISFGETCSTDDSDFDGWSDSQENSFNSNPNNSTSTPYSIYFEQIVLYNLLLNEYNESQIIDTDGDSWSDAHETLFGSIVDDSDSTPLTILSGLESALKAANIDLVACQNGLNTANRTSAACQSDYNSLYSIYNACVEGWSTTNSSYSSCQDELNGYIDSDNDGWTDSVEFLCGSNSSDVESQPTVLIGAICWELADDDLDGVRNIDDACPSSTIDNETINSTGCTIECETCNENGFESSADQLSDDEIDITGEGDVVDLIVIGGVSLLAGIGITSILSKPGTWEFKKPKIDASKKEIIKDIVKDIDLDLDFDNEVETTKLKKGGTSSSVSDQYFKSGVERQKAMTTAADPLLDDYIED
jgi:hypothetical protein